MESGVDCKIEELQTSANPRLVTWIWLAPISSLGRGTPRALTQISCKTPCSSACPSPRQFPGDCGRASGNFWIDLRGHGLSLRLPTLAEHLLRYGTSILGPKKTARPCRCLPVGGEGWLLSPPPHPYLNHRLDMLTEPHTRKDFGGRPRGPPASYPPLRSKCCKCETGVETHVKTRVKHVIATSQTCAEHVASMCQTCVTHVEPVSSVCQACHQTCVQHMSRFVLSRCHAKQV